MGYENMISPWDERERFLEMCRRVEEKKDRTLERWNNEREDKKIEEYDKTICSRPSSEVEKD